MTDNQIDAAKVAADEIFDKKSVIFREYAEKVIRRLLEEKNTLITDLMNELKSNLAEIQRLKILAERNYPELKASGACSAHKGDGHYECETCYYSWPAFIAEHCRVKDRLYEENERLKQRISKMTCNTCHGSSFVWPDHATLGTMKPEPCPDCSTEATNPDEDISQRAG